MIRGAGRGGRGGDARPQRDRSGFTRRGETGGYGGSYGGGYRGGRGRGDQGNFTALGSLGGNRPPYRDRQ